jgi:hypothetical protein
MTMNHFGRSAIILWIEARASRARVSRIIMDHTDRLVREAEASDALRQ